MKRVIAFGASNMGKMFLDALKNKYDILYFCDNDRNKWGKSFYEYKIISPNELSDIKYDEIIITSTYYKEITSQLVDMKINNIRAMFKFDDIIFFSEYNIEKLNDKNYILKLKDIYENDKNDLNNFMTLIEYLIYIKDYKNLIEISEEWLVKSDIQLKIKVQIFYFCLYYKLDRYDRFNYISEIPSEFLYNKGLKFLNKYYSSHDKNKITNNNTKRVLFVVEGFDFSWIVIQFYLELAKSSKSSEFEYYILCATSLKELQTNNYKDTIKYCEENNINYYIPQNYELEEEMNEIYSYIDNINPQAVIFQTVYHSPISSLIFPYFEKNNIVIGRTIHQQPESFFDKRADFVVIYFKEGIIGKEIFDIVWPLNLHIVEKNYNIRDKYPIDINKKIIVSLARDIYFRNNELLWKLIIKIVTTIDNVVYVVFGPKYDEDYAKYIPKELIEEGKIIMCGFDREAAGYLKSCDFFFNTFPLGGGASLQEAYYAELPVITFCLDNKMDEKYDMELNSYFIPKGWYNDAEKIFPTYGEIGKLYNFTKKIIEEKNFKDFIQSKRKIDKKNISYEYFITKLEEYLKIKIYEKENFKK